jgi:hypothetical protein
MISSNMHRCKQEQAVGKLALCAPLPLRHGYVRSTLVRSPSRRSAQWAERQRWAPTRAGVMERAWRTRRERWSVPASPSPEAAPCGCHAPRDPPARGRELHPYCQTSVRRIVNLVVCCMQGCDARHRPLLQPVRRPAPSPVVPISQLPLSPHLRATANREHALVSLPCPSIIALPLSAYYQICCQHSAACITVASPKCVDPRLLRQVHLLWALRDSKKFCYQ